MDGNNRWSKKNKYSKYDSYKIGAENLFTLTNYIFLKYKLPYVSAFVLSSHNLKRSNTTLKPIIRVFEHFANSFSNSNHNFDIKIIGDYKIFDSELIKKIENINNSKINSNHKLNLFINYSGRKDIELSLKQHLKKRIKHKNLSIIEHMQYKDLADPDMLIRTGGFSRLSDYTLYNLSFTELFFLKKLWPDFNKRDLDRCILKYFKLNRKFGY